MKRLVIAVALLLFAGCSAAWAQGSTKAPPTTREPVYVDVRTDQEYAAGHVRGAKHIPYDQMEQRWVELQKYKDQRVILYCRSGHRAGVALKVLEAKGFTHAENGGGFDALAASGVPVEKTAQKQAQP